jgi:sulfite exporter TauE/SafE
VIALLAAVLVSSLAGSLHCAAMCGPFAGLAGGSGAGFTPHLAYGAGRLAGYGVLGAIAGVVGAAVDLASVGGVAMIVAGIAMLVWGTVSLARAFGAGKGGEARGVKPMLYAIKRKRPVARGALVGLLTAALPCGWLYAFVVVAAGTGSPVGGALVMATFWLGTMPALLGAGLSLRALARRLGARLPVVTACLQIAIGVVALTARAPMVGHAPSDATEHSCH